MNAGQDITAAKTVEPNVATEYAAYSIIADQPPSVALVAAQAWHAIQNTTNIAVLEDFIRRFGSTEYGKLARAQLDKLDKSQIGVNLPDSQELRDLCHPPGRWVKGELGYMCQCPDGRFAGAATPCMLNPDADSGVGVNRQRPQPAVKNETRCSHGGAGCYRNGRHTCSCE
jgi:hypothetical protein